MPIYQVGALYHPQRTRWPERIEYNYRAQTHELRLFLARLTPDEIAAIATGPAELAVVVRLPVILVLCRFGTALPWSEAPYTIHLVPAAERTIPPVLAPDERPLLHVILVEATTGIIRAVRVIALAPRLAQALHTAIREQAAQPWDAAAFDQQLARLQQQGTPAQYARQATARMRLAGEAAA